MYHIFIHSSVDGHLRCFHVLAIVNSAAVNIKLHVSFWIRVFFGYMPRSGIAGSYGNSVFSFLPYFFLLVKMKILKLILLKNLSNFIIKFVFPLFTNPYTVLTLAIHTLNDIRLTWVA